MAPGQQNLSWMEFIVYPESTKVSKKKLLQNDVRSHIPEILFMMILDIKILYCSISRLHSWKSQYQSQYQPWLFKSINLDYKKNPVLLITGKVCCVQCAVCSVQCALCILHCAVLSEQYAVCSVQCARLVCSVQSPVDSVDCALYGVKCVLYMYTVYSGADYLIEIKFQLRHLDLIKFTIYTTILQYFSTLHYKA